MSNAKELYDKQKADWLAGRQRQQQANPGPVKIESPAKPKPVQKTKPKLTSNQSAAALPTCVKCGDKVGKLICNCANKPEVFTCSEYAVGYCIPTPTRDIIDGKINFTDGSKSVDSYLPWQPNDSHADMARVLRLPVCSLCERKIDREPDRTPITINADINGIGDAALECWYPEVQFYATGIKADAIRLFGGKVVSEKPDERYIHDSWGPELKSFEARIQYRAEWLGVSIIRRPPVILEEQAVKFAASLREPGKPLVVCVPHSTHATREWPQHHWPSTIRRLRNNGCTVLVEASRESESLREVADFMFIKQPIQRMAALLNESDLVISCDTGPAHFAGNMNKLCLLLMGPTIKSSYCHVPSVIPITSSKPCTHCNFQHPYNSNCNSQCASLNELIPEMVVSRAMKIIRAKPVVS